VLSCCRHALSKIKIPDLMTEDLLASFFEQNMVVPTTKKAWEQLRMDIADSAALLFTPTYVDSFESIANPLDLPVSLLIRDMQPREYDFMVNIDSHGVHPLMRSWFAFCAVIFMPLHTLHPAGMMMKPAGEVTGEVRLPHGTNRGMKFATHGPGTEPGTVRPPCPHVGYAVCSASVALDGIYLPQAVSRHHAASIWSPPKTTFEGDNMLLMPRYKCALSSVCAASDQFIVPEFEAAMCCDVQAASIQHAHRCG
jgi:hypothetical protein